jgi:beta-lactamase regulating signal transducer with metallopeptidase domain/protocatechuate 3,4-dioxygenase beta subunit
MHGYVFAWRWLAHAAVGGFFVLALGTLAALCCRQPVRRARVIVLTVLGAFAVPLLSGLPIAPKWSAGFVLNAAPQRAHPSGEKPINRGPVAPSGAIELPVGPVALDGSHGQTQRAAQRSAPEVSGDRRPARSWLSWSPEVSWYAVAVAAYALFSSALAAWWVIGQVLLWRVTRAARPVPPEIVEVFHQMSGTPGRAVLLLRSQTVCLPFTFTWARPVIVLPASLCDGGDSQELRFCLAHEWSHVERHDARAWNLTALAGFALFYQPLFWWLRRQLRLCQDYLADDRAASLASADDYATYLVCLARARQSVLALPALGVSDRRSNLYRRIVMLVKDHEPLEHRCRTTWSLAATALAGLVMVIASGLSLEASGSPKATGPANGETVMQDVSKATSEPKQSGETLNYRGTVKDKDTGKGIAGATVVVRRSLSKSDGNRVLQETRHTTDAQGTYSFTIPPEQVAERYLYIELDVEHPSYATRAGFGYSLSMIRKNEKLNERPFFETIEMRPAEPITGRVETPAGEPAAGVELLAYSRTDKLTQGHFEYGSFARATTDADGKFRLPITTPGKGVYWVLPKTYAPQMHVLADGQRGDVGTITLHEGAAVTGRAFDVQGKPLAGLYVEARRDRNSGPDSEVLGQLMVSDAITRTAETDADGRFTLDPLPPGSYRVMPTDFKRASSRSAGYIRRALPGVFTPMKLTIELGEVPQPLEVRASPHVVIEGNWLDSKGQPKGGWGSSVFGKFDGSFWHEMTRPDNQGKFTLKVPHGLEDVQLDISTNEHASSRHRIGKDGPLVAGRTVKLGTLDHDVKGIEIVRYVAPIIILNATTQSGQQIKGFKATVEYSETTGPDFDKRVHVVGGEKTTAIQDEQYDGRFRTSQLLPDSEVNVTVSADGFATASRKLSLPEGKIEEVTFVLEPK